MSEQPIGPDDFADDEGVTGPDPGDALVPGSPTDVPHERVHVDPLHPDWVAAADVPTADAGGRHL